MEVLGRPQVMVAEGLNVRPAAVCTMLRKTRREGLKPEDEKLLERARENVTDSGNDKESLLKSSNYSDPKVLVLKRKRRA